MKKIPAFNIPFYEFTADEQLTSNILSLAKKQIYIENKTNNNSISSKETIKNKELINWFNSCLEEVKNDLYDNPIFDIKVTDAWFNKSSYTQQHNLHAHPNSLFGGVFYLTTHVKKSKTKFFFPNPFHHADFSTLIESSVNVIDSPEKYLVAETQPVAGKLIIFPSSLEHSTEINISREDRYTIAFNSFFSGILGKKESGTMLNVIVQYPDLE